MRKQQSLPREHKVLPFICPEGNVPGHAINAYPIGDNYPTHVAFWTFDSDAGCEVEYLVHASNFTLFAKRSHKAHSPRAVILDNGQRISVTSQSAIYGSDEMRAKAPILARGLFGVALIANGGSMLEVAGVRAYLGSFGLFGDREPDPSLILDPWERDNAIFHAQLSQVKA